MHLVSALTVAYSKTYGECKKDGDEDYHFQFRLPFKKGIHCAVYLQYLADKINIRFSINQRILQKLLLLCAIPHIPDSPRKTARFYPNPHPVSPPAIIPATHSPACYNHSTNQKLLFLSSRP